MTYLFVLAFILAGSFWLELALRTRVLRRWRRLLLTLLLACTPFVAWDLYAIAARQWWFDPGQLVGVTLPAGLPLEELLFFPVVAVAAILTLEAVRAVLDTGPAQGPPAAAGASGDVGAGSDTGGTEGVPS